jgi:hypothetical protein
MVHPIHVFWDVCPQNTANGPFWGFIRGTLADQKVAFSWKFYPALCPEQDIS